MKEKDLRSSLLAVLEMGKVFFPNEDTDASYRDLNSQEFQHDNLLEHMAYFLDKSGMKLEPSTNRSHFSESELHHTQLLNILRPLREFGLVEVLMCFRHLEVGKTQELYTVRALTSSGFVHDSVACKCYVISEKGLGVALKYREHSDNERRHNETAAYSKKAFVISICALLAAIISACLSWQRLYLYEKQVNKVEAKQAAIVSQINCNIEGN